MDRISIIKNQSIHSSNHDSGREEPPLNDPISEPILQKPPAQHPSHPTRRTWIFIFLATIPLPILVLVGWESALRVGGYGYSSSFFMPKTIHQKSGMVNNPEFGLRFFPKSLLRKASPFWIADPKEKNTFRIFLLGESAALGDPNPPFGFGRILERMLQARYPSIRFEIVNVSVTAINSHAILPIAKECLSLQPDLLLLYMGNNEVIGPFGAASAITPYASNLFFIQSRLLLLHTKIGQWIQHISDRLFLDSNPQTSWKGMEMMSEKNYVRLSDPHLQKVYNHFESNLQAIVTLASHARIPLLVSTIGTNLRDCPPLASLHNPIVPKEQLDQWNLIYQKGIAEENESHFPEAVDAFLQAEAIDPHFAELQFLLGRCYLKLGDPSQAKSRFILAQDEDVLRFRADSEINRRIRKNVFEKATNGIYFIDIAKMLEEKSPDRIPGSEFFYEHVHFNFSGNYNVACSLLDAIGQIVPVAIRGESPSELLLSEKECKEQLAFTLWDRYKSLKNVIARMSVFPFTQQIDHREQLQKMKMEAVTMEKLLTLQLINQHKSQYEAAIEKFPDDWQLHYNYGRLLMASSHQVDAVTQFFIVTQAIPHHVEAHFDLGVAYLESENYLTAMERFQQVLTMQPDYMDAFYNIAFCSFKLGKTEEAIAKYQDLIRMDPSYENAYYQLGSIYFKKEDWPAAEGYYAKVIELNPQSIDAYISLGLIHGKQGNYRKALDLFNQALEIQPDNPSILRYVHAAQQKLQ